MIPSKAYNNFRKDALKQIIPNGEKVEKPYMVHYKFFMKGKLDTDIDNMIAGINDILQEAGVIEDDKFITRISAQKVSGMPEWETYIDIHKEQ